MMPRRIPAALAWGIRSASLVGLAWFASAAAPGNSRTPVPLAAAARCPSPSGQEVVQTVRLPGTPGFLLLRSGTLWVAIASTRPGGRGLLARIDARTGRVQRKFRLPNNPYRIAYGFGSLWVTGEARPSARRYAGVVLRLDPGSGRILSVIRGPILFGSAIATTSDGVWVGGGDVYAKGQWNKSGVRFVFKIDPRRNAVVRRVRIRPTTVIDLAGDGRFLWATGWGAVVKLSPSGRVLFQQRFGGSGWAMALSPGAVWVAQPFFGTRDPRTQRRARRLLKVATQPRRLSVIELDTPPADVAAAAGVVWFGAGGLARVEAGRTPPAVTKVPLDVGPNRIAAFRGGVWIDELDKNELRKIC
jgi:hypothetical protein